MTLRLAVLLGPRETVEAAERLLPAMPHTLAMAVPFDSWSEAQDFLPAALSRVAAMLMAGIKRGEHLAEPAQEGVEGEAAEPPPVQPASPAPVVRASAGPDTTDERYRAAQLVSDVLMEMVGRSDWETWARVEGARDAARRIVALVERRAA